MIVMVNGVATDVSGFAGADSESFYRAQKRSTATRIRQRDLAAGQGSTAYFPGTPRHRKHKGDSVAGVRFK
jgi:hypothetical protein